MPSQTYVIPGNGVGIGLTATSLVVKHPPAKVYVTVVLPSVRAETTPVEASIVATVVLLLIHVPPVVALLRVVVAVAQTFEVPVIAAGVVLIEVVVLASLLQQPVVERARK